MGKALTAAGHVETSAKKSSTGNGSSVVGAERKKKKITPEERAAAMKFFEAAYQEAKQYNAMTEEEVEDEYRRAGKLHTYDPDNEWKKRCARAAIKYPPPKSVAPPDLDDFYKCLEEDEADYQLLGFLSAVFDS